MMQTTSAGDLNGDGFADLIVQWAYGITTPKTELRVFFGGIAVANTPDLSIPGRYVNDYTLQHSGRVGDLNGDGFEDIALTAFSDERANGGMVQLFVGERIRHRRRSASRQRPLNTVSNRSVTSTRTGSTTH